MPSGPAAGGRELRLEHDDPLAQVERPRELVVDAMDLRAELLVDAVDLARDPLVDAADLARELLVYTLDLAGEPLIDALDLAGELLLDATNVESHRADFALQRLELRRDEVLHR